MVASRQASRRPSGSLRAYDDGWVTLGRIVGPMARASGPLKLISLLVIRPAPEQAGGIAQLSTARHIRRRCEGARGPIAKPPLRGCTPRHLRTEPFPSSESISTPVLAG